MLYVGSMNGKALVFHDSWGITVRNGEGGEFKQVIGKSIVSTLAPGRELNLASGPLLEKVSSMSVLADRCPCQHQ